MPLVHSVAMTQSKSREISILPEYSDESGTQKLKNGEREDSVDLETENPFKFFFSFALCRVSVFLSS